MRIKAILTEVNCPNEVSVGRVRHAIFKL
uniref:Uncharacterized protein n=1 Tax=Anguilla anguilla TaxID=7936 RepID=A0A0E9PMQ2_ANGAN